MTVAENERVRAKLYVNRFGAYSYPTRSMEEFFEFAANGAAMDKTFDFMDNPEVMRVNDDLMAGLDAAMSSEDRNMVEYYKRYVKNKH